MIAVVGDRHECVHAVVATVQIHHHQDAVFAGVTGICRGATEDPANGAELAGRHGARRDGRPQLQEPSSVEGGLAAAIDGIEHLVDWLDWLE